VRVVTQRWLAMQDEAVAGQENTASLQPCWRMLQHVLADSVTKPAAAVCSMPAGLASPQLKSATGSGPLTAHRESCLVLPNSSMAPSAVSPPAWQSLGLPKTPASRSATPKAAAAGPADAGSSPAPDAASLSPQQPQTQQPQQQQQQQSLSPAATPKQAAASDEYNYVR
jgi:hypothetical protein